MAQTRNTFATRNEKDILSNESLTAFLISQLREDPDDLDNLISLFRICHKLFNTDSRSSTVVITVEDQEQLTRLISALGIRSNPFAAGHVSINKQSIDDLMDLCSLKLAENTFYSRLKQNLTRGSSQ